MSLYVADNRVLEISMPDLTAAQSNVVAADPKGTEDHPSCRSEGCDGIPFELNHYEHSFPAEFLGYCWNCAFWLDYAGNGDEGTVIAFCEHGRERFHFDPDQPVKERTGLVKPGAILGYGGRRWLITFTDGRTVTTNDLWYQGIIPGRFEHLFPVNTEEIRALPREK
jgi:hypothetical protein